MKKKNSYIGPDDSRFSRALHRARHHDQQPTKESPARKPQYSFRPTMSAAPENTTSLAILFSQETKENRPPGLTTQIVDRTKKKKKKNIWKWGPIRSMGSRSSGDRFPCSFSIYIDSINGLPFTMNALCLFVKLHKKNENTTVQTRPCRVLNGTADIDETLQIQSSVRIDAKYDCNIWVSVCALEMGGVALSTHCIDISRLVPQASGFDSPKPGRSWATTVKLSGRAKGALLVVTFACQLLGDGSSAGLGLSTLESEPHLLTTSPTMSELNLDDVPSLESLSSEEHSCQQPPACSDKGLGHEKSAWCDAEKNRILPKKQAERPPDGSNLLTYCDAPQTPRDRSLRNLESGNDGNAAASDYSSENDEVEFSVVDQGVEMGSIAFTERCPNRQEDNPSEKMQMGVDYGWQQGNASSFREQMQLIEDELARLEACLVAEDSCKESKPVDGGWNAEDGLKEKMLLCEGCHSEGTLAENPSIDKCLNAGNITKESLYADGNWSAEDSLIENLSVNETWIADSSLKGNQPVDVNWKRLDEDDKKAEETFLHEIARLSQGKQVVIGSSDEDTDSVTGEFLNLLESGQNASNIMSGSESNFPPALLLREFGQGLFLQTTVSPSPNLEEDLGLSLMDAAKLEMQKAEQAIRSKARAKILEDAETQALMQQWGLNEKAFKFSPPKTDYFSAHGKLIGNLISSPPLEEGLGSLVKTKDGGYIRSMNPGHFVNSKIGGRLVMHVSKPVVVPAEMGSSAMDLLRKMAAFGIDNLTSQAMMSMPMEDITGKTIQQVAVEESRTLEGPLNEVARPTSRGTGYGPEELDSHVSLLCSDDIQMTNKVNSNFINKISESKGRNVGTRSTKDSLDEYVSVESLAPLAMQKIEALALEGLKIQSTMADEDAPCYVDPLPSVESNYGNTQKGGGEGLAVMEEVASTHKLVSKDSDENPIQAGGILASAISLEKWMELDMGIANEADQKKNTRTNKAAHQDLHVTNSKNNSKRKQNNSRFSCMNETLTIAMLVQLRDPLRNYEPVGVPMIAIIQAERVIKPPRAKLSKQVPMSANAESEEDAEEQKPVQLQPQFKITEVHMAGLKAPDAVKKEWFFQKWGSKKQEQSGSRWLIANGMGKKNKPDLLKSKASPSQSKTTVVKPGETLWSISSRVHGTGSKWQEIASLNPHIRNPDIIFPSQTIRMK